jgi:2Fe-2S ferredoxin
MVQVSFIAQDGTGYAADAPAGLSLMKAAVNNDIPGIDADCGGACACATCHVYVPEAWRALTGEAGDEEKEMLDCAISPAEGSRLSCQIILTDALDGLVVHMPAAQR